MFYACFIVMVSFVFAQSGQKLVLSQRCILNPFTAMMSFKKNINKHKTPKANDKSVKYEPINPFCLLFGIGM